MLGKLLLFVLAKATAESEKIRVSVAIRVGENFLTNFILKLLKLVRHRLITVGLLRFLIETTLSVDYLKFPILRAKRQLPGVATN